MPTLCVRIIDTPQFQRLRYIKQLGCCYLVYPGAAHNRFEHSLGVSHLAGTFCRKLQQRQSELNITEKDVLCVQIAGLCHDLGHGPFSHMFERFIKTIGKSSSWKHEHGSVDMFNHLIEANQLKDVFAEFDLDDLDITFIKEQIGGQLDEKEKKWPYRGRSEDKRFLYDIVANKRTGIDVDKWDYLLRDSHNLGFQSSFDCHRIMEFSRVIEVNGKKQICARDKGVDDLYDMFNTRNSLHRTAYKHRVSNIIEIMIVEALVKANDHLLINGKQLSEAIYDMVAYTNLTDDITRQILRSDEEKLQDSRSILELVEKRQHYPFIGQAQPPQGSNLIKTSIPKSEIIALDPDEPDAHLIPEDDLIIDIVDFNYGMEGKNPIDYVRFYSKENPNEAFFLPKGEVSQMLPRRFAEQQIRFYFKSRKPEEVQKATECVKKWCAKKDYVYKAGHKFDPELTPAKTGKDNTHTT